jgi:hypothetical protein
MSVGCGSLVNMSLATEDVRFSDSEWSSALLIGPEEI